MSHVASKTLIIGHICKGPNAAIAERESWQELEERDVMKFARQEDEVKAVQYFFKGEAVLNKLNEPASGVVFTMHDTDVNVNQDIMA
ncbi:hypothetical protein MMC11_001760 [Xylographa trunciseda]|nr:hypothetical protein [Xylographa trunciseda]